MAKKRFYAMGYPFTDNENAKQTELFAALQSNKDKMPLSLTVYLLRTRGGRLLTVCEWPEDKTYKIDATGELWGDIPIFKKWVEQAGAPMYQDAEVLGPRRHSVKKIDGPSKIVSSFTTGDGPESPPKKKSGFFGRMFGRRN